MQNVLILQGTQWRTASATRPPAQKQCRKIWGPLQMQAKSTGPQGRAPPGQGQVPGLLGGSVAALSQQMGAASGRSASGAA